VQHLGAELLVALVDLVVARGGPAEDLLHLLRDGEPARGAGGLDDEAEDLAVIPFHDARIAAVKLEAARVEVEGLGAVPQLHPGNVPRGFAPGSGAAFSGRAPFRVAALGGAGPGADAERAAAERTTSEAACHVEILNPESRPGLRRGAGGEAGALQR
jgi:hypothetical protein